MKNLALLCSTRHNRTLVGIIFYMKIHSVNRTYIQLPLKPSNTKEEKMTRSSAYIVWLIKTSSPTSPTLPDELNYRCQMHKIIQNYPYISQTGAFINIQATSKESPSYFFFIWITVSHSLLCTFRKELPPQPDNSSKMQQQCLKEK